MLGSSGKKVLLAAVLMLALGATAQAATLSPDLHELVQMHPVYGRKYQTMLIVFQLAAMLVAAKLLGWAAERVRVPGVVGELLAGAIIGPFLLGSLIPIPMHGDWVPLFPRPGGAARWPLNDVVWTVAQLASIVLLFMAGLHTNLRQFFRYIGPAAMVAVAGVVLPFALGAATVYIPAFSAISAPGGGDPAALLKVALFVGAILAATSIGISARVLGDIGKLETPEGVTILGAAVLDDVLGIIVLAVVAGMADGGGTSAGAIGAVAIKAVGFWVALTVLALLAAPWLDRWLRGLRYGGATVGLALAIALASAGAAESFGLAFIIGAYSVGLGLSRTRLAGRLLEELRPISDFIVPIFFAALGMLVNFQAIFADWRVISFGLVVTAAAVVGKLVGCGAAALPSGFNLRGAWRIGLGMTPRGEVALIVAAVALSRGLIGSEVFGVAIMMTLLTTVIAPILLVPAFAHGGSGRRSEQAAGGVPSQSMEPALVVPMATDLGRVLLERVLRAARAAGWEVAFDQSDEGVYVLRSRGDAAQMRVVEDSLRIDASDSRQAEFAGFVRAAQRSLVADASSITERKRAPR